MPQIDNLKESEERRRYRLLRRTSRVTPGNNQSVTGGRTRFMGNESLIVEGSQKVSGWLIVTGTLKVVGEFLLEGATTMTGNLISSGTALFTGAFTTRGTTRLEGDTTQVGPFHVEGATDITGSVDIEGALRILGEALLNGSLTVGAGGEIKVGDMVLAPTSESGAVGSISSPVALNLKSALVSMSGSAIVDGRLTVVDEIRLPFVGSGTGTPLVIDAFGRIVKQA